MTTAVILVLSATFVGIMALCSHIIIKRAKEKAAFDEQKREENRVKMAFLRERKAQKKLERLVWEEQRRQEELQRQEALHLAMDNMGVAYLEGVDEYVDGDNLDDTIGLSSNENLDIDKFLKFAKKNEWDEGPILMRILTSPGATLLFFMDSNKKKFRARIGEGSFKKFPSIKAFRNYVWCFCQNEQLIERERGTGTILVCGIENASKLKSKETEKDAYLADILKTSDYAVSFNKKVSVISENDITLIEYELPAKDDFGWVKEYKYVTGSNTVKEILFADSKIAKDYEQLLYSICLRSIYEVCVSKKATDIMSVVFNGFVTALNKASGIKERKCILSLQVNKERFLAIDLRNVDPKKCFKSLKGVSAAQLIDISPIQPVLIFNKNDCRFIEGKAVQMSSGTNLASMDWEDFEHLVRELFELEFSRNGGEVRVTQASRDGGVDAIVFDPDPLRGGKIVIQAKRYTNTVGVSAVRDLYGTVINEGANSGILITTSDYGHDSYEFAKDKPLKLLNGGHLLALLQKNGKEGYINIQEAKEALKEELLV